MSQVQALASHWVLLFFLGLLNKYMLVWSIDYPSTERISQRRDYIHRIWTEWTEWSACSRTCGGGVKMRTRMCKISAAHGAVILPNSCIGETVEYELCSVHNCSPYDKEFLEYQCSLRDGQTVRGKRIEEWIPYRYGKNPCELQCWSKDRSIVYSFGKAIDGTKCATSDPRQPALCINVMGEKKETLPTNSATNYRRRKLQPVDCAGQIGTDNKLDRCGICRGNNSTCIHYKDIFWERERSSTPSEEPKDHHYDYEKIATIPAGVTEIIVKESSETNFLALMDHKSQYLINANWRIQSPGRVIIHGSEFIYNRTWDGRELISAQGPTRYEIHVYVLGSGNIPTVNLEYWISTTNPLKPIQPFPVLNQLKQTESKDYDSKYLRPEDNHIHDTRPTKKNYIPVTQFQGYKSYYHRNEILKSVPSWSVKRHRTHKNNFDRYLHAQNDISSSTVKNSVELNTAITPSVFSYGRIVKENVKFDQSERRKNVSLNIKTGTYRTRDKIHLTDDLRNTSLQKVDIIYSRTTVKPVYSYNIYNINQRQYPNITNIESQRKYGSSERNAAYYRRSTTVSTLLKSDLYSHQNSMATVKPTLLPKVSEIDFKDKDRKTWEKSKGYNEKRNGAKRKRSKKKRRLENGNCQPCPRPKQQRKNFCISEFVLRATVLSTEKQDDSYRYELQINQSYKNRVPISPREYIWSTELCRCPKLRMGKEYVIMGYSGTSGNKRESRLLVDKNSFVKKYSPKRARTIQRLVRDQNKICRSFQ